MPVYDWEYGTISTLADVESHFFTTRMEARQFIIQEARRRIVDKYGPYGANIHYDLIIRFERDDKCSRLVSTDEFVIRELVIHKRV
jgi:hypothetical protein